MWKKFLYDSKAYQSAESHICNVHYLIMTCLTKILCFFMDRRSTDQQINYAIHRDGM